MRIKDLKQADYNPRKIIDEKLAMMKKSMIEFGDLSGIIFNIKTGNLIGGHQRIKNLDPEWEVTKEPFKDSRGTVARGFIKTPFGDWVYREVEWDEKKEKAANLAANKHSGDWDIPKLKDLINELDSVKLDMDLVGFEDLELKAFFSKDMAVDLEEPDSPGTETEEKAIHCPKCGFYFNA